MNAEKPTVGVIVARFQSNQLHSGWRFLIEHVSMKVQNVVVVLGSPPFPNPDNPLSFESRRVMVWEKYSHVHTLPLQDQRDDAVWSQMLDELILEYYPDHDVRLFHSRDSFVDRYTTKRFLRVKVPEHQDDSGTEHRERVRQRPEHNEAFRAGVVHGWRDRLTVVRPMVDVAILRPYTGDILLGRKKDDPVGKWRFIGGLVDPEDETLERAAKREVSEEAGDIAVDDYRYVCSQKSGDWRYQGSGEYAVTTLFRAIYIFGAARPGDDLHDVKWFPVTELLGLLVPEHIPLGEELLKNLAADTPTGAPKTAIA